MLLKREGLDVARGRGNISNDNLSVAPPVIANLEIGRSWSPNRVTLKAVDGPRRTDKTVRPSIRPFRVENPTGGAYPPRRTLHVCASILTYPPAMKMAVPKAPWSAAA
jgi:hypothetical protein